MERHIPNCAKRINFENGRSWYCCGTLVADPKWVKRPPGTRAHPALEIVDNKRQVCWCGKLLNRTITNGHCQKKALCEFLEPCFWLTSASSNARSVVAEITKALVLPKNVTLGSDSHYRCSKCLYGGNTEEDWDD